jgi:FtsP/CotA-like multicopper oxidase with cupredoxin domain
MALIKPTRGAQYVVCSEYAFTFSDTVVDINGVTKDFGTTIASAPVADIINMPPGAEVVGGQVAIVTQGVGPTAYTIDLGVAGATTAYHSAASLLGASGTKIALTNATPRASATGLNVRMTMVDSVAAATAGSFRVSVLWKMDGRTNEATPS